MPLARRPGNPVHNPYELKTKGEMVADCRDSSFLNSACELTRSCAKANHREHWINKKGPSGKAPLGCGACIPCLFRRAALHKSRLDQEIYGIPVELVHHLQGDGRADLLALITFLRRNHSDREIAAGLLGNGTLPFDRLSAYVDLVKRMRIEVLTWLRAKGSPFIKKELRSC